MKIYYEFINYYNTKGKDFIYDLILLLYNQSEKHYMQLLYINDTQEKKDNNILANSNQSSSLNENINIIYEMQILIDKYKKLNLNI